jgi:hypothetical protein
MTPLEKKERNYTARALKDVRKTLDGKKLLVNTWSDEDHYAHPQKDTVTQIFVIVVLALAFGITLLLFAGCASASENLIDMNKIMMIESGGRNVHSNIKSEHAIGLFQITPVVLKEYNQFHHTNYKSNDLYDTRLNTQIASWYLNKRIPAMLRAYKKPVTTRNIIVAYNAGISYVVKNKPLPSITKRYLKKYGIA